MAKKKTTIPEKTKEVKVMPQDLNDQWGAVQACATAFNVLDKGYFPHSYAQAIKASLQFLQKLHEQSLELILKHPQAHMIDELKELLKDNKAKSKPMKVAKDVEVQAEH